ncbi:hypothetical protein [Salinimicrobium sp. GXAS 041]|uniref:hypothetical protein n=1 Tax=Salinimicrobium sp. GXAS 041 TaxID=3400806 RepID=UPI003C73F8CB
MRIRFSKRHLRTDFLLGGCFFALGCLGFVFQNPFLSYGLSAVGILNLVQYFYKRKEKYLEISNNELILNIIFQRKKKINLKEVTRVKKFAGEITFFASYGHLKINTDLIAKEDLWILENAIASVERNLGKDVFLNATIKPSKNPLFD